MDNFDETAKLETEEVVEATQDVVEEQVETVEEVATTAPAMSEEPAAVVETAETPEKPADKHPMALISMILGIVGTASALGAWIPFLCAPGITFGVAGLVLGIIASKKSNDNRAKIGIILSAIAIALPFVFIMLKWFLKTIFG